ncbi:MAG: hypothetical protein LBO07_01825 [Coriobacteriales bacterium]|jgi:hypothetical protein|nr:hypothetical protein [Coriobacteriales bacterium]
MSLFRFEFQTDLSLEECVRRLDEAYKKTERGELFFKYGKRWPLWISKTENGAYKFYASDGSMMFIFIGIISERDNERCISCTHNPFRPTAWGIILPFLCAALVIIGLVAIPYDLTVTPLLWCFAAPVITFGAAKESTARHLLFDYFETVLDAKPYKPKRPKSRPEKGERET